MSATKNPAFILRTQDYRDTSVLGDFYTRDHGRIRGIVKGIRDTRARYGSTLEPFSLNEILFYKKKKGGDLHLVTQVESLDEFPKVRQDLERLATASYCIELISEFIEAEEPQPELFDLLKDTLDFLSSGASCKRGARIFEVKLLDLLGLMPEIRHCVACRLPAACLPARQGQAGKAPEGQAYFNPAAGGIQCKECAAKRNAGSGLLVSKGTLNFLEHAQRSPLKELYHVKVSHAVGEELEKLLRRFTDYQLTHKLKSLIFMEKMGF